MQVPHSISALVVFLLLNTTSSLYGQESNNFVCDGIEGWKNANIKNLGLLVNSTADESMARYDANYLYFKSTAGSPSWMVSERLKGQFTRAVSSQLRLDLVQMSPDLLGNGAFVWLDEDQNEMVFVRNGAIQIATKSEEGFTTATPLFNAIEITFSDQIAISSDKQLMVVSGSVDTENSSDLYQIVKNEAGWNEPVLIDAVNTENDELNPELSSNNDLVFASDRVGGVGGLDLYISMYDGRGWQDPKNLCEPINSVADDVSLTTDKMGSWFLSSDRSGGIGGMDLYGVEIEKEFSTDCIDQSTGVKISVNAAKDPNGEPLTYLWDFGDGQTGVGYEVSHTYTSPGLYTIILSTKDEETGWIYDNEAMEPVQITFKSGGTFIESMDESISAKEVRLSAAKSLVEGEMPIRYQWRVDNEVLSKERDCSFTFAKGGAHLVQLSAVYNVNGKEVSECVQKEIMVKDQ